AVKPALQAAGPSRRILLHAQQALEFRGVRKMERTAVAQRDMLVSRYELRECVQTEETRPFQYDQLVN
ncbi:unnamed protein product, partial [Mycena citricolor]